MCCDLEFVSGLIYMVDNGYDMSKMEKQRYEMRKSKPKYAKLFNR